MTLEQIETNDSMIALLLQLEADLVQEHNASQVEEDWIRENGEV